MSDRERRFDNHSEEVHKGSALGVEDAFEFLRQSFLHPDARCRQAGVLGHGLVVGGLHEVKDELTNHTAETGGRALWAAASGGAMALANSRYKGIAGLIGTAMFAAGLMQDFDSIVHNKKLAGALDSVWKSGDEKTQRLSNKIADEQIGKQGFDLALSTACGVAGFAGTSRLLKGPVVRLSGTFRRIENASEAGKEAQSEGLIPKAPDQVHNPYLEEFNRSIDESGYKDAARDRNSAEFYMAEDMLRSMRQRLVVKYGYAAPDSNALSAIAKEAVDSPIVELGAGNGYLAYLLRQMDLKVRAFDNCPVELEKNDYFNRPGSSGKSWTAVEQGDESVLKNFGNHTLLLSWPPKNEPMAANALRNFPGKKLIYIGQPEGGHTADDSFFNLLEKDWQLEKQVDMPYWPGVLNDIYFYKRVAK